MLKKKKKKKVVVVVESLLVFAEINGKLKKKVKRIWMIIAKSVRSENHQEPRPETKCLQLVL